MKAILVGGPFDGKELEDVSPDSPLGTICVAVPWTAEEMHEFMTTGSPERYPANKIAYYRRRRRPEMWSGTLDIYDFTGISE